MKEKLSDITIKLPLGGIGGLQYISYGSNPEEHLQNIKMVCESGVKWIQLRLKNVDNVTYLTTAMQCREICDQYEAIMIINDQVDIAKASQADGVHLGLNDMSPKDARNFLGDHFIIGGTANTFEDCMSHVSDGVDYIGLGPYRFTETKDNLSPVLGTQGYQSIVSALKNKNVEIPIIAIGGILKDDISDILRTGVSGIAASGMLTSQNNLKEKVAYIKELLVSK